MESGHPNTKRCNMTEKLKVAQDIKDFLKQHNAWWKWDNHKYHAILSSGAYSDFYVNCTPLLSNPPLLQRAAAAICGHVRHSGHHLWVFGPAYGGIVLANYIAMFFPGANAGFAEKTSEAKQLRTIERFTPFMEGPTVIFCEDVVTSLSSVLKMRDAFLEQCPSAKILPEILAIINRSGRKEIEGFEIKALIDVEAKIWQEEEVGASMPTGIYPKKNWKLLNERN